VIVPTFAVKVPVPAIVKVCKGLIVIVLAAVFASVPEMVVAVVIV